MIALASTNANAVGRQIWEALTTLAVDRPFTAARRAKLRAARESDRAWALMLVQEDDPTTLDRLAAIMSDSPIACDTCGGNASVCGAGLGWVSVGVEPGIVSNRHWGRLYSVVGTQANHLAFGIDAGTAVEFRAGLTAPRVVGDSAAVVLDGRYATFGVGSNDTLAAHWVILDTFVGGESIAP